MALVCPADHPPGVGTSFCRLCGRAYVEVPDAVVEEPAPPVTKAVVPSQAPASEPLGAEASLEPTAWPPAPAPVTPAPVPVAPAPPPAPPVVAEPPAPPVELVPVTATGGLQVHLPLIQHVEEPLVEPEPATPAPTDTHPVDLGGPTVQAPEGEPEPEPEVTRLPRAALDRTALLAGVLGGFLGGAVSGAAVTLFLS